MNEDTGNIYDIKITRSKDNTIRIRTGDVCIYLDEDKNEWKADPSAKSQKWSKLFADGMTKAYPPDADDAQSTVELSGSYNAYAVFVANVMGGDLEVPELEPLEEGWVS